MHLKKIVWIWCLLLLLSIQITEAKFTFHNETIKKTYQGGEQIQGPILFSFAQEPVSSIFTSNFPGNITLLELLRANDQVQGIDYNCSTNICGKVYRAKGTIQNISLSSTREKVIGFSFNDEDISISAIDFSVSSSLGDSCKNPFIIKILGSNTTILSSTQAASNLPCGSQLQGCFDSTLDSGQYQHPIITQEQYCENITLNPAPAYMVGARIEATGNSSSLIIDILDNEGTQRESCTISQIPIGSSSVSCRVNMSVLQRSQYFLCISSDAETSQYKIKSERDGAICGGTGIEQKQRDFDVFAQPLAYAGVTNYSLAQPLLDNYGLYLTDEADAYIEEEYGRDCSYGCALPFLISGEAQTLEFSNASITYSAGKISFKEQALAELEEQPASISSNYPLSLSIMPAQFTLPLQTNVKTLQLYLNGSPIFTKPLNISVKPGFEFRIAPTFALVGVETLFSIVSSENISSVQWEFKDSNEIKNSSGKTMVHRYTAVGNYSLTVIATNKNGTRITKTFEISAGNPEEASVFLLNQTHARLATLEKELKLIDSALLPLISESINITLSKAELNKIEKLYANASTTEEYQEVVDKLLALDMPLHVGVSAEKILPFGVGFSSLNEQYMLKLSNKTIPASQIERLRDNIIDWNHRNFNATIDFKVISKTDAEGVGTPLISEMRVQARPVSDSVSSAYLIIDYPRDEILFNKDTGVLSIEEGDLSGAAVPLPSEGIVIFRIAQEIDPQMLGMHLAPSLDVLGIYEESEPLEKTPFPTTKLLLLILLLLLGTFSVYIGLQEWYKRRYERHLFKNPDELYNLMLFIRNGRLSGNPDELTKKKLGSSGWNSEQINYALRKLDGKRTGMLEIPIFRPFERKKIEAELAKRRQT